MAKNPAKLKQTLLAEDPSPQQQAAIFAEEDEYVLRASPGSGKTWTSCRRFLWRLENWQSPNAGLALLSFTNRAISEFEKAARLTKSENALSDPNFIGTFDSFVERFVITPFGHLLSGRKKRPRLFLAPRPGDRKNKDWHVFVKTKKSTFPVPAWDITPIEKGDDAAFVYAIGNSAIEIPYDSALKALKSFLDGGFYTHVQRNFWACLIIQENPRIAKILSKRFPEIIVDEAQDTNAWQVELLRKLRTAGAKITLIGDPDQCIFEFSLASVSTLKDLKNDERDLDV